MFTASACSTPEKEDTEPITLKILAPKYSMRIQQLDLAALYKAARPNVQLDVVDLWELMVPPESSGEESFSLTSYLESADAPDVLILQWDPYTFEALIDRGLLLSLDSYIEKDQIDLTQFAPIVREALTSPADGSLYGLAPSFFSYALFYNKDLLDAEGVPYPQDGETWEELWSKAEVFAHPPGSASGSISGSTSTKDGSADAPARVGVDRSNYGQSISTVGLIETILTQQGRHQEALLRAIEEGKKPVLNTPERRALWEQFIDLQKRGVLNILDSEKVQEEIAQNGEKGQEPITIIPYGSENSAFIRGKAPFLLASWQQAIELYDIITRSDRFGPLPGQQEIQPFAWDVATFPVDPSSPEEGSPVEIQTVFVIPSKAQNPEEAWRFIRTAHNEKVAKILGQSAGSEGLMTYIPANRSPLAQNIHAEAFWKLAPTPVANGNPSYVSEEMSVMLSQVYQALENAYREARSGHKSIEEALREAEQSLPDELRINR
ncbi:MAG: N-Acetyl-D-glucosamine ABC transport system, sugar-binding protein [Candidatus Carbobacillus altaicus]|uniref:N-Acetyl-D-glucosamine ABC transport system, sugar-binding protein n=1 Tax=Candidatus Carbonibacillus altaicus TaxID=2163959 RepID=A0A2R6Y4N0_9BACL|nr:MAG: N-Acetyl-D-glucosamine ABC transport system, sugar-binding protein [Candidatus Carbobacillus altaicus]